MYASDNGHTATVEVLVRGGADMEAKNKVREIKCVNHTDRFREVLFTSNFLLCSFLTCLFSISNVLLRALSVASFAL